MPLWLAQFLLLGAYGGIGYLVFFSRESLAKLVKVLATAGSAAQKKVDELTSSRN
jgi:hypothetical protein